MKHLSLLAALMLPAGLHAQAVPYGLSVDRDNVRVQQTVRVVVNFEAASRWCGLRVDMGDGDVRDILVEDFPLTLTKQYLAPGRYVLRAQGRFMPRGITSALGCDGSARAVTVTVDEGGGERRKRDAEQARERAKRDREEPRPAPAPAPAPGKPRDGTLKVF